MTKKTITIELTEEEYLRVQYAADMIGKDPEFIAEMGMRLYMIRIEEKGKKNGIGRRFKDN